MNLKALIAAILLLSPGPASAETSIFLESRDVLGSRETLRQGDELTFPTNFKLSELRTEQQLATAVTTGNDLTGRPYVCAFSISAETEVRLDNITHWTVASFSMEGDVQRLVLQHEQFGVSRPLELRCVGVVPIPKVLETRGVKLFERIPVELVDDRVPASAFGDISE